MTGWATPSKLVMSLKAVGNHSAKKTKVLEKTKKVASNINVQKSRSGSPELKSYGASRKMLTNVRDLFCAYNHIINTAKTTIS